MASEDSKDCLIFPLFIVSIIFLISVSSSLGNYIISIQYLLNFMKSNNVSLLRRYLSRKSILVESIYLTNLTL